MSDKRWTRRRLIVIAAIALLLVVGVVVLLRMNNERLFDRPLSAADLPTLAAQIKEVRAAQHWKPDPHYRPRLTREVLLQSARQGCAALAANQRPAGNFNYEYNFVARTQSESDNQVRQAGALWGVAFCYAFDHDATTRAALERGLDFFRRHSTRRGDGALIPRYPGKVSVQTGTAALVSLALIDYLRAAIDLPPERRRVLESMLDGYLILLQSLQFNSGAFSSGLIRGIDVEIGRGSPYYDGETLLALIEAAKYLGRRELLPVIQKAAARLAQKYTVEAWRKSRNPDDTKSFYQWGTMAFAEYQDAGWPHADLYADAALALSWWVINVHGVGTRSFNTGYAYEGLVQAWRIAQKRGDEAAASRLLHTIDAGLYQLTTFQVEGPLIKKNRFLLLHRTSDPLAVGAILNEPNRPTMRLDVTQHQMHAVLLALDSIYQATP
jgi:hypothetical protein